MIHHLPEDICCNYGCNQKLQAGANTGGWKAVKQQNGDYVTGYQCKKCGNQSTPSTRKLSLFQTTQHYATPNPTNTEPEPKWRKALKHEKQWNNLLNNLKKEAQEEYQATKMPAWKAVMERAEEKIKKREKK